MDYALTLNNVSKQYDQTGFRLDNISFQLPTGTIMGFVGENGAGKTTTIGCILNTLFRDSGSICLFGKDMTDQSTDLRDDIGVVYDGGNFPAHFTAGQIAGIFRGIYKNWDDALFQNYLNRFDLKKDQKIKKYSKGMTMKLAIAAALSHHPKLLILDEATGGLDPVMREEILDIFLDFVESEAHSILLSSHITSDLEKIADYITFIHHGKIILSEAKDCLLYDYALLRCTEQQMTTLDQSDFIACRRQGYQYNLLTDNRHKAERKYTDIIIDHPSIDEIMLTLIKGENQ